ncbi:MAG: exosortase system-associated protein, TIGR04073 family [Candidatus Omnitrophica bacterium]|nr:exosortase system-associated protein, TIGR04073 family [Candidatus Omnitrophota bacterium]
MKKIIITGVLCFLLSAANTYAQEKNTPKENPAPAAETNSASSDNSPLTKLGRGAVNTVTCWAEIPAGIYRVSKEDEPVKGFFLGTIEGVFTAALRAATGIADMLTFVIPPYDKPPMQPEYALANTDE